MKAGSVGNDVVPVALLLAPLACSPSAHAAVASLRCEHLGSPNGIDVAKPRLSWVIAEPQWDIETLKSELPRGLQQTAYRVLIATSEEPLRKDKGDFWDSGKMTPLALPNGKRREVQAVRPSASSPSTPFRVIDGKR